jgi:hypothetical protein
MAKIHVKLWLSPESIEILQNYAFFHETTIDDIADGAIMMFPFHEGRTKQIQGFSL